MAEQKYLFNIQEKGASQVQSKMGGITKSIKSMVMAGASIYTVKKALDATVGAAVKQEQIFRKLQTSVELSGKSYESVKGEIDKTFSSLQAMTEYGDTDSAEVLTTLVQLTGNYEKSLKNLPLVLDMASTGLFDAGTAARYVAMALEGNAQALGRYVPALRASNNEIMANGTAAEQAAEAMRILNEKFGGSAQKNLDSVSAKYKQFKNYISDVGEAIGGPLLNALKNATDFLIQKFTPAFVIEETIDTQVSAVLGLIETLEFLEETDFTQGIVDSFNHFTKLVRENKISIIEYNQYVSELINRVEAAEPGAIAMHKAFKENAEALEALKTVTGASTEGFYRLQKTTGILSTMLNRGQIEIEFYTNRINDLREGFIELNSPMEMFTVQLREMPELLEQITESIYPMSDEFRSNLEVGLNWATGTEEGLNRVIGGIGAAASAWQNYFNVKKQQELADLRNTKEYLNAEQEQRDSMEEKILQDYGEKQKKLYRIQQAQSLASIAMDTASAYMKAWALSPATFGMPWTAAVLAAGAIQAAAVMATPPPAYAEGGVIAGSSYSGDNVTAKVNSGEMILNQSQQAELFSMIKAGQGGGATVHVHGDFIGTEENADKLARIIAERSQRGFNRIALT
jgi:hypothetical protein